MASLPDLCHSRTFCASSSPDNARTLHHEFISQAHILAWQHEETHAQRRIQLVKEDEDESVRVKKDEDETVRVWRTKTRHLEMERRGRVSSSSRDEDETVRLEIRESKTHTSELGSER